VPRLHGRRDPLTIASSESIEALPDPFAYTTGRWLHRDEVQRNARFLKFDFPFLSQKAVKVCPGAKNVVRYEKKEGGFNRVFILHMDNGTRIVARLPFRVAGPRSLTTHSGVATMSYCEASILLLRVRTDGHHSEVSYKHSNT
jgi:hypothetical protein